MFFISESFFEGGFHLFCFVFFCCCCFVCFFCFVFLFCFFLHFSCFMSSFITSVRGNAQFFYVTPQSHRLIKVAAFVTFPIYILVLSKIHQKFKGHILNELRVSFKLWSSSYVRAYIRVLFVCLFVCLFFH